MRLFRSLALCAALLTSAAFAFGQGYYHTVQFHDHSDRAAYRQGYDQGRSDARSRRGFHPDSNRYRASDDRRAYRDGYEAGFRSVGGYYGNNGGYHGNNGGFGGGRGYGNMNSIAEQNGYRDGMNDGRKDRATGHSFRPTQDDNYKNAPGYSSSMGDRQQYKDIYRQGYQRGYQIGYNGR